MSKLLIVDDFASQRSMLKLYLADTKLEFLEASNGQEALQILRSNNVVGVLTDLEMPVMTGMELLKAIRNDENLKHLPVTMITSVLESQSVARNNGVTQWVHKPFQREYLVQQVTKALGTGFAMQEYNVLLIDDVSMQTAIWSKTLKMDNFNFIEASNAQDGLNKLRAHNVDVIITDYLMPQVDGTRFIRKIKSMPEFAKIPIFMITTDEEMAEHPPSDVVQAFKKPFNPLQVKAAIRKAVGLS